MSASPRPYDPERHARRLAPIGAILAVLGCCFGGWPGAILGAAGLAVLLLSCVSAVDGMLVVGPFAWFELIRSSRTRWLMPLRMLYVVLTLLLLILTVSAHLKAGNSVLTFTAANTAQARGLSHAAGVFFLTFVSIQLLFLTWLTVQWIAPIIAEERESKRLDLLLTTDLRSREILLGKAAGRLPRILEPVLATLPVLALLPFFGGVSPKLVFVAGLMTLASILGTAGVAFFYSAFSPSAKKAIESTSGFGVAYLMFSGLMYALLPVPSVWSFPTSLGYGTSPVEFRDFAEWVNYGNPIAAVILAFQEAKSTGGDVEALLTQAAWRYTAFHLALALLFGLTAAKKLRTAQPWESASVGAIAMTGNASTDKRAAKAAAKKQKAANRRPPVSDDSVFWWERYGALTKDQLWLTNRLTWKAVPWIVLISAVCCGFVWVLDLMWPWGRGHAPTIMSQVLRMGVWFATWPIILGPMFRATTSIARERVADTLEGLRLTALTGREILYQKWFAQTCSELPLARILIGIILGGMLTGLFPILGGVWLMATTPIYTGAATAIGLYFSVRAATPGKASGQLVFIGGGLLYLCMVVLPIAIGPQFNSIPVLALMPMAVTGAPLLDDPFGRSPGNKLAMAITGMCCGLLLYSWLGMVLFNLAVRRFDAERKT